jgi:hypothetical protein
MRAHRRAGLAARDESAPHAAPLGHRPHHPRCRCAKCPLLVVCLLVLPALALLPAASQLPVHPAAHLPQDDQSRPRVGWDDLRIVIACLDGNPAALDCR